MAPNGTTRGGCCHVNLLSTSPFLYHQENLTYLNNGMVNAFKKHGFNKDSHLSKRALMFTVSLSFTNYDLHLTKNTSGTFPNFTALCCLPISWCMLLFIT